MSSALVQALDRVEAVVRDETHALSSDGKLDLADITARKNQSLLELSRLAKRSKGSQDLASMRSRLTELRGLLEENSRLLDLHVRASKEVSGLISSAISAQDSDGTYSARIVRSATGA